MDVNVDADADGYDDMDGIRERGLGRMRFRCMGRLEWTERAEWAERAE